MPPAPAQFRETRWSVILAAQGGDDGCAARELLCEVYWYPLYAFVRRSGHTPQESEDLTQEFFARLLAKEWLIGVDPSKGRFRSFLLASMSHFLANEWRRTQTERRGGRTPLISLDAADAESRYAKEPVDKLTPEVLYQRRWALTVIEQVFSALRAEMEEAGKSTLYEGVKDVLSSDTRQLSYAEIGARLGMSEDAVKMTVYRLRRRYRDLLRAHIAVTVGTNAEIDEEIRDLFRVFSA